MSSKAQRAEAKAQKAKVKAQLKTDLKKLHTLQPESEEGKSLRAEITKFIDTHQLNWPQLSKPRVHPDVTKQMNALEEAANQLKVRPESKEYRKACDEAEKYSQAYFVKSVYNTVSEDFSGNADAKSGLDSDTDSDSDDSELESDEDTDIEGSDTNMPDPDLPDGQKAEWKRKQQKTRVKKEIKSICIERDEAAKLCHQNWNNIKEMKKHARKAHELQRDYLRLVYAIKQGDTATPIPRKLIDATEHKKFAHMLLPILLIRAELQLLAQEKPSNETTQKNAELMKQLKLESIEFHTKSHPYLAKHNFFYDDSAENYYFYDDNKGKPDSSADFESAEIPLTANQKRRRQERERERHGQDKVAAYRGNLVAMTLGYGDYNLLSLSEQFLWTARDLQKMANVYDAGDVCKRRLDQCKIRPLKEKRKLITEYKAISGIAHRGVDTLNMDLVKRAKEHGDRARIGDCMIKLGWKGSDDTWEIRSDFRQFRGSQKADWEIYDFARIARAKYKSENPDFRDNITPSAGRPGDYLFYGSTEGDDLSEQSEEESKDEDYATME